ncbi:GNAT family N-acetyltransferase [Corallococcus sp. H22C18031201]|uniref:GNAT family N-acetyltransferase n=1 Tax=Citreicoccus inhibens TaxID=2849499 RepID=UPI000E722670|nr:GNAT family protein [Citreicoccus inhibens]MBU8896309.1 GNAT family N-acetyltransferase [Citreicoccus inhibens]RJS17362.1 GNAT family N-acetyltransferase [Corallococcus sp. H22C18031201]
MTSVPLDSERPHRELVPLIVPPVTLEGRDVRLAPLGLEHAPALTALCEEEIFTHFSRVLRTREDVEAFISSALSAAGRGTEQAFVVLEKTTGEPLGSTRYLDIQRDNRTLEIGYTWLGRRAWRTRVNTECKYLLLRHAFEQLQVMRVQLKTDRYNARSRAAIERMGATFEGILRNHMLVRGGVVRDSAYYGVIDTDWPEVKARLEGFLQR